GPASRRRLLQAVLPAAIFLLLGANLWATYTLSRRLPLSPGPPAAVESSAQASRPPMDTGHGEREQFAQALHGLLQSQAGTLEWSPNQLQTIYRRLLKRDERLRVSNSEGQAAVAALSLFSRRSVGHIETAVRDALKNRGYDVQLIELACQRV